MNMVFVDVNRDCGVESEVVVACCAQEWNREGEARASSAGVIVDVESEVECTWL